jgi:hypothetical protein
MASCWRRSNALVRNVVGREQDSSTAAGHYPYCQAIHPWLCSGEEKISTLLTRDIELHVERDQTRPAHRYARRYNPLLVILLLGDFAVQTENKAAHPTSPSIDFQGKHSSP